MADDEAKPQTLQERIAALNMGHVGRAPVTAQPAAAAAAQKRPVPQPPMRRTQTASIPTNGSQNGDMGNEPSGPERKTVLPAPEGIIRTGQRTNGTRADPNPPAYTPRLPTRTNTTPANGDAAPAKPAPPPRLPPRDGGEATLAKPSLPTRRPSERSRRGSQDSTMSTVSTVSTISTASITPTARTFSNDSASGRMRAPAYDPSSLPPLPPKRTQEDKDRDQARLPLQSSRSNNFMINKIASLKSPGAAPPLLPRRSTGAVGQSPDPDSPGPAPPPRKMAPTDIPMLPSRRTSPCIDQPPVPPRPSNGLPTPAATPPPIPAATRPDLSKLLATKPKPPMSPAAGECLPCRDFSAADAHAAKFPRQNCPSLDWLAQQLVAPFPSATDQARTIFAWLHYNIDYNTQAFFSGNLQPSTPQSTLTTGLAVCEGYAGLFAALATKAGLAALVVVGHGKGYGYAPVAPGSPLPPPNPTGHAWNAVRIDGGAWKLLDPCWGAGHVNGRNEPYKRSFTPAQFTRSNADFGRTHFPQNPAQQFRPDGTSVSWADYLLGDVPGGGDPVQLSGDVAPREGFDEVSFEPRQRHLAPRALPTRVRFSFQRVCVHWDPLRHGPGRPYAYVLALAVPEGGQATEWVPLRNDGRTWWAEVEARQLGRAGDKVFVNAVTSVGGQDARGIEWDTANMFKGMGFAVVAMWEVV